MTRKGYLIGIEGIDAVGKRTQTALLNSWLKKRGNPTETLSFPDYETPIGRQIRAFLTAKVEYPAQVRHLLFAANRWEKAPMIKELLDQGKIVTVNRYTESNLAYGVANRLPLDWLIGLEAGIPKTNLVVVLDAPSKELVSRRPGKDSYEKNEQLQRQTRTIYKQLAKKFGWEVIEATGDVQNIHRAIMATVEKRLRRRQS